MANNYLPISGTFTATGQSSTIYLFRDANLSLVFAGTATVTLQRLIGATWVDVATYTSSAEKVVRGRNNMAYRLNCTSYTNDVDYYLG